MRDGSTARETEFYEAGDAAVALKRGESVTDAGRK